MYYTYMYSLGNMPSSQVNKPSHSSLPASQPVGKKTDQTVSRQASNRANQNAIFCIYPGTESDK